MIRFRLKGGKQAVVPPAAEVTPLIRPLLNSRRPGSGEADLAPDRRVGGQRGAYGVAPWLGHAAAGVAEHVPHDGEKRRAGRARHVDVHLVQGAQEKWASARSGRAQALLPGDLRHASNRNRATFMKQAGR
uniref:hypothetical protein n=1 Tax=Nonomuraea bangladeshensis TaxID=404385 RepID=UPI003F494FD4